MKRRISIYFYRAYTVIGGDTGGDKIGYGGAEINLINLAAELAKNPDFSVSFYVGDYGKDMLREYKNVKIKKMRFFHQKYKGKFYSLLRALVLVKTLLTDRSRFLITSTAIELLGQMAVLTKFRNKKIIFRLAHDDDTDLEFIRKNYSSRFLKYYAMGLKRTDAIVAQNSYQLGRMKEQYPGKKIELIKNAFSVDRPMPAGIKKNEILWVARCNKFKRPMLFLDLAERLPDHTFTMIIPANDSEESRAFKKEIKDRAAKLRNIEIIDYVPFEQIMDYFYKAKLFVNTSESEGFPNTFIQAAIAHTPILSFTCNPDNAVTGNDIGLLCNDNLDEAVRFITGLTDSEIKRLGDNAYGYYLNNHSIEVSTGKYIKIMDELE